MKKVVLLTLTALAVLSAVLIVRALAFVPPSQDPVELVSFDVDANTVAEHLSQAIRIQTISYQEAGQRDALPFEQFITWAEQTYPELHSVLTRERVAEYSLLFEWRGRDESLSPVLLTAHHDVVPVLPGTESAWEHDPFGGVISGGFVWGRGALDDKGGLVSILEAVVLLVREGFQPTRTIYLAFGHDEEQGGHEGAAAITAHLRDRGVRLAWTLDEGSFVTAGMSTGIDAPVAVVSVAEKGGVTLELVARADGGHSSMPPPQTAVSILAEAIVRLTDAPLPGGLDGISEAMFSGIARHASFPQRLLFANRWLFGRLLESFISESPTGNAMLRTTTAPTMLSGSEKVNVLPIEATARVNFRLHPRDTADDVLEHARRVIDDDRVESRTTGIFREPSAVSSTESQGYLDIARATRQVFGDVIVVPGLTVGGTDSKHYHEIADDSYRFHPMIVTPGDAPRIHGTNERISVDDLARATRFYAQLMKLSAGGGD